MGAERLLDAGQRVVSLLDGRGGHDGTLELHAGGDVADLAHDVPPYGWLHLIVAQRKFPPRTCHRDATPRWRTEPVRWVGGTCRRGDARPVWGSDRVWKGKCGVVRGGARPRKGNPGVVRQRHGIGIDGERKMPTCARFGRLVERFFSTFDLYHPAQLRIFLSEGKAQRAQLGLFLSDTQPNFAQLPDFLSEDGRRPAQVGLFLSGDALTSRGLGVPLCHSTLGTPAHKGAGPSRPMRWAPPPGTRPAATPAASASRPVATPAASASR